MNPHLLKRRHRNADHSFEAINVTPMIDVVMCLIIFFLLVGKLATDRSAALRLPQSKEGEAEKASDTLVINVTRTPPQGATEAPAASTSGGGGGGAGWPAAVPFVISEDRTLADAGSLERLVRTRLLERPLCVVQVRAERDLAYGSVQPVLSALARGGAKTVRLALERTQ